MIIETSLGKISGQESTYSVQYFGIPYAKPPIGKLRWRAPQKLEPWSGIYHADSFPHIAPQNAPESESFYHKEFYHDPKYMPEQSEDCLYLNIWTPKEKCENCPVAIWLHGGAFAAGFCSEIEFDGEAYAKQGIILITVGYRLGILGYLAHPTLTKRDGHSGNYGMLDQIAAVDWVREHIASFGGDPEMITLMGQSAGGMSVRALVSSPLMKGKAQRAIIQSAGGYKSPLPVNTFGPGKLERAFSAAMKLSRVSLHDLYEMTLPELLKIQKKLWKKVALLTFNLLPLCPQVDGYSLTETCDSVLEHGEQLCIPYLIGCNQNDSSKKENGYRDSKLHKSNAAFCNIQGNNPDTYLYYFKRKLPGDDAGAFHSAELWYMFGTLPRCWRPFTKEDYILSQQMVDAWSAFIKTGNPGWSAYKKEKPFVQVFDVQSTGSSK